MTYDAVLLRCPVAIHEMLGCKMKHKSTKKKKSINYTWWEKEAEERDVTHHKGEYSILAAAAGGVTTEQVLKKQPGRGSYTERGGRKRNIYLAIFDRFVSVVV